MGGFIGRLAARCNALMRGVRGSIPAGSRVSRRASGVAIGDGFYASGPVWIEAVTSYEGAMYQPRISIGRDVRASPRLHISAIGQIAIGNAVLFGENVFVADHQHGSTSGPSQSSPDIPPALRVLAGYLPIQIGDRCHLGNNVVILPGTMIGEGTIVGANSVVRGQIPAKSIAVGAPARVVKMWDETRQQWVAPASDAS